MNKTIAKFFITLSIFGFLSAASQTDISSNDSHLIPTTQAQSSESTTTLPPLPKPDFLPGPTDPNNQNNPEDIQTYFQDRLLPMAAQRLVTIIALLAIISLIFAGFKYYTAFGTKAKLETPKKSHNMLS